MMNNSVIMQLSKKNRIPLSCTIELTTKCNFKCIHCYMQNSKIKFIDLFKLKLFIKEFKNKGGKFITFTGGETLLYPNFEDLYLYAYEMGFRITIFTNGFLLNEKIINFFAIYKPYKIEVSLYGYDENSYKYNTKSNNSFTKIINNIYELKRNNINLVCKMVLTNYNIDYFDKIKELSKKLNVMFRYDYYVWPKINGELSSVEYQCNSKQIVNFLISQDSEIIKKWKNIYKDKKRNMCFNCSGGRNSFYLNSNFEIKPCLYGDFIKVNLNEYSFDDAWEIIGDYIDSEKLFENSICNDCKHINLCEGCPAYFYAFNRNIVMNEKKLPCCQIAYEKAVSVYRNIELISQVSVDLIDIAFKNNERVIIPICGTSMEPTFYDGEKIILRKSEKNEYNIGDIIAYKNNKTLVVHRIIELGSDFVITKGDNSATPTKIFLKDIIGIYNGKY